jgi:hypothetical protein
LEFALVSLFSFISRVLLSFRVRSAFVSHHKLKLVLFWRFGGGEVEPIVEVPEPHLR